MMKTMEQWHVFGNVIGVFTYLGYYYILYIIYGLFNHAVNSLDYTVSNDRIKKVNN